jgi:hypothetical protein
MTIKRTYSIHRRLGVTVLTAAAAGLVALAGAASAAAGTGFHVVPADPGNPVSVNPGSRVALNPQPLPPGALVALNPQPLPPAPDPGPEYGLLLPGF